ncbi:putative Bacterial regulatory s, gntR family protein [Desulfamplus magnetovallimortis]|uniref:Putative Bacterial regulatory s, gntR family protein n=1 Tax=Desulfamplus magnetovallimortis TaxID=1246637 RepID=A0A1W1HKK2_9BACT|nr:GntR family transcriptional regulator [Desulfamplus magnetovallimortis]SLM33021.1 putative Bacterial regulatory s, gntR family protein [Desulfamplus magnetovallimortis]
MKNLGIDYENLDQKVYQVIKNMIEERKLLPGEKIPQEKLAKELGISRTPLISALKFLEHEKLVQAKPRRGYFVRLFTTDEMISIFEIRELLEGLSARRAALSIKKEDAELLQGIFKPFLNKDKITDYQAYSRADRKFHTIIAQIGSKEFLTAILQTLNIITLAYQNITSEGLIREPNDTIDDHLKITEAICSHDSEKAEMLMREHLQGSIKQMKTMLKKEEK